MESRRIIFLVAFLATLWETGSLRAEPTTMDLGTLQSFRETPLIADHANDDGVDPNPDQRLPRFSNVPLGKGFFGEELGSPESASGFDFRFSFSHGGHQCTVSVQPQGQPILVVRRLCGKPFLFLDGLYWLAQVPGSTA